MVDMEMGCTRAELLDMIHQVLDENVRAMRVLGKRREDASDEQHMGESDDVHIRLMVSRG